MPSRGFKHLAIIAMLCIYFYGGQIAAKDFDDSVIGHIGYPAWFKTNFYDLQSDLSDAADNDKIGLMLFFTTQGCSYCAEFIRTSLADDAIVQTLQTNFDVIGFEIFDDNELTTPDGIVKPVKEYAKDVGADFAPTMVFVGTDGNLLLRRIGYESPDKFKLTLEYLTTQAYLDQPYHAFIRSSTQHKTAAKSSQGLIQNDLFTKPPYMLDRSQFPASEPMLVIFEAINCIDCGRFHEAVMQDDDTRKLLSHFQVVRFDMQDHQTPVISPTGERTTPAEWYASEQFTHQPAMLFYDEQGKEVLRIDALALKSRMTNSLNYVLEKAYLKDWSYQRFARTKSLERARSGQ